MRQPFGAIRPSVRGAPRRKPPPRGRLRLATRVAPAMLLVALASCGETGRPEALPAGQYAYSARHAVPDGAESMRLQGLLVVSASGEERVEGRWEVSQLHPEVQDGRWRSGAYELEAIPTYEGRLVHRIVPLGDGRFRCEGEYLQVLEGGVERRLPVACTLGPAGGERGEDAGPAPGEAVRPTQVDTLVGP